MSDIWVAPFHDAQIAALQAWQDSPYVHSYTCGNPHPDDRSRDLIPTRDGWVCPVEGCTYHQDWAHGWHDVAAIQAVDRDMKRLFSSR